MNGAHTFVYLLTCGCVFSQAGLKAVTGSAASGSTPPAEGTEKSSERQLEVCPQCATKYDKKADVLVLNPDSEKEEEMRATMELRRLNAPSKKSKKRKAAEVAESTTSTAQPEAKKSKASLTPSMNPTIAAASRAVVSSLVVEEAKRKAAMSDAVKSLYESKDKDRKETFMTRATFTRVSYVPDLINCFLVEVNTITDLIVKFSMLDVHVTAYDHLFLEYRLLYLCIARYLYIPRHLTYILAFHLIFVNVIR